MMPPTRPSWAQLNETRSDLAGSRELSEYKEESETNSSKSLVQEGARVQLKKYFAHIHVMGKTSAEHPVLSVVDPGRQAIICMRWGAGHKAGLRPATVAFFGYGAFFVALMALSSPLSAKAKSVSAAWGMAFSMFLASSASGRPSTQLVTSPLCGGRPMPMRKR